MKRTATMLTLSLLIASSMQACFVTVTNDTDEAVMLYDANSPQEAGRLVNPNEQTVFGNKTTKADFVLAQKIDGTWSKRLQITQTMCGMTEEEEREKKDKFIDVSGILNRDLGEVNDFFTVEDYDQSARPAKTTACGCKHKKN